MVREIEFYFKQAVNKLNSAGYFVNRNTKAEQEISNLETQYDISFPEYYKEYISYIHNLENLDGVIYCYDEEGSKSYVTLIAQPEEEPFREIKRIFDVYQSLLKQGLIPFVFFEDAGPLCINTKKNGEIDFVDEGDLDGFNSKSYVKKIFNSFEEFLNCYFLCEIEEQNEEDEAEYIFENTLEEIYFELENNSSEFSKAKASFHSLFPNSAIVSDVKGEENTTNKVSWLETINRLDALLEEHKNDEFGYLDGKKWCTKSLHEAKGLGGWLNKERKFEFLFEDLWEQFYQEYVKDPIVVLQMAVSILIAEDDSDYGSKKRKITADIFGEEFSIVRDYKYRDSIGSIIDHYFKTHVNYDLWFQVGWVILDYLCKMDYLGIDISSQYDSSGIYRDDEYTMPLHGFQTILLPLTKMSEAIYKADDTRYFELAFPLLQKFYHKDEVKDIPLKVKARYFHLSFIQLNVLDYVKAGALGVICFSQLIQFLFSVKRDAEYPAANFGDVLSCVTFLYDGMQKIMTDVKKETINVSQDDSMNVARDFIEFTKNKLTKEEQNAFIQKLYTVVMGHVLEVELIRGKKKSEFSKNLYNVVALYGAKRMITVLKSIEKVGISKSKSTSTSPKAVWSYLLKVSRPDITDDLHEVKKLIADADISDEIWNDFIDIAPVWKDYL